MPHFATHHTTEEHVKKKKKKSTDPKEATSPECKCRRAPSSSHYLQCRRILNSLRISRETDPTERKTLRNRHRIKHGTEFRSSRRTIGKNQIQRAEIGCRSQGTARERERNKSKLENQKINYAQAHTRHIYTWKFRTRRRS